MNRTLIWKAAWAELRYMRSFTLLMLEIFIGLFLIQMLTRYLHGGIDLRLFFPQAALVVAAAIGLKPDKEARSRLHQILPLSRKEAFVASVVRDLLVWASFSLVFALGLFLTATAFTTPQHLWQVAAFSGLTLFSFSLWRLVSAMNYVGSSTWWKVVVLVVLLVVKLVCLIAVIDALNPQEWLEAEGLLPASVAFVPLAAHCLALLLYATAWWLHRIRSDFTGKTEGTFLEGLGGMR